VQVIKKINNNVVVCKDGNGRELIAFGKGLGFPSVPYELTNLNEVQRTFYNINSRYLANLDLLPTDILEFTSEVVDVARGTFDYAISSNLVLTLADHINFAFERKEKNIFVKMPLAYDLEQIYPEEMSFARKVIRSIWNRFHVRLSPDEASGIALAFINSRTYERNEQKDKINDDSDLLEKITIIIEENMRVKLEKKGFNYSRYATHVRFLLQRLRSGKCIDTINQESYFTFRKEYPETATCVDQIVYYLETECNFKVETEEKLYLMLHVNRVCTNEGL